MLYCSSSINTLLDFQGIGPSLMLHSDPPSCIRVLCLRGSSTLHQSLWQVCLLRLTMHLVSCRFAVWWTLLPVSP